MAKEFDKVKALRRYRSGEKVTDIAADMGVSKTEVYSAIRELKRAEEWDSVRKTPENSTQTAADGISAENSKILPSEKKSSKKSKNGAVGAVEDKKKNQTAKEEPAVHSDMSEGKAYIVLLRDGTKLRIDGVCRVYDRGSAVTFTGKKCSTEITVSAAELLYYYNEEAKGITGGFTVN